MEDWDIDAGQHLILELSKISKDWSDWLVVQKPVYLIPDLILKFRSRFVKFLKGFYKTRKINKLVTVFTPKIPFHLMYWLKNVIFSKTDIFILNYQLNKLIGKNYPGSKILLWVYMPKLYPLTKSFKYDYLIYYIQDNSSYSADSGEKILPDFDVNIELIKKCNIIFSSSNSMYQYASQYNNNAFHIPNGNNFSTLTSDKNYLKTTELDDINKPVIGYLGGIRCWIDFKLIQYLLENMADCYIVFIGPLYRNAADDINVLMQYKNFRWIKFKEQHELPAYLEKFKAGIIPFKLNKFMGSVFPNKFFEYMSGGIPVVTNALPELKKYSDIIGYSNSKKDFLKYCKDAVNGKYSKFRDQYIELAKNNTWSDRAVVFNKILKEYLKIN